MLQSGLNYIILVVFNQYIMQALCVSRVCFNSRNNLNPCDIPLNSYNRNETQHVLALNRLLIWEVSCVLFTIASKDAACIAIFRDRLRYWDESNIYYVVNFYV